MVGQAEKIQFDIAHVHTMFTNKNRRVREAARRVAKTSIRKDKCKWWAR
ncbi:MAG: hypothetical protein ACFFCD_17990 [Promethearchaeota archaeon]